MKKKQPPVKANIVERMKQRLMASVFYEIHELGNSRQCKGGSWFFVAQNLWLCANSCFKKLYRSAGELKKN